MNTGNQEVCTSETFDFDFYSKNKDESGRIEIHKSRDSEIYEIYSFLEVFDQYMYIYNDGVNHYFLSKIYYKNGVLKEKGKTYIPGNGSAKVGVWCYFKKNGHLDKRVNYDTLYPVNWETALDIASKEGLTGDDRTLEFEEREDKLIWIVSRELNHEEYTSEIEERIAESPGITVPVRVITLDANTGNVYSDGIFYAKVGS